jgi:RNA polymerase sigma-70 factor (ECF subfamily)
VVYRLLLREASVDVPDSVQREERVRPAGRRAGPAAPSRAGDFRGAFIALFDDGFVRLYRYLDRVSGDPELAADLAQEAFVRLYRRGSMPDAPDAWLVTVALNLYRNVRTKRSRRTRLLTAARSMAVLSDPPPTPSHELDAQLARTSVRAALDALSERDRNLLLLSAAGYAYRDIARALELNETSIGTLLARARRAFLAAHGDAATS